MTTKKNDDDPAPPATTLETTLETTKAPSKDPLHGVTLEAMVNELVDFFGWPELGERIPIRCFMFDPTIKSSLTFLRKTPWAREKLENWYVGDVRKSQGFGL